MLHGDVIQYEDFDPDYTSQIFKAREKLLANVQGNTLLPEYELHARALLNDEQMETVQRIRTKRLAPVLNRFIPD